MRFLRFFLPSHDYRIFRFDKKLVEAAAIRYGMQAHDLHPVRHLSAYVFHNPGKSYLKLTSESVQTHERIRQINEWQNYLSDRTTGVVSILPSIQGADAEQIYCKEEPFTSVMYANAPGRTISAEEWNPDVFRKVGALTGTMHRLTKDYPVSKKSNAIPDWRESIQVEMRRHLPAGNKKLQSRYRELTGLISTYSRSGETYGIIHGDIHKGNLLLNNGHLTLVDFDDACRSWFMDDIANVFLSALLTFNMPWEGAREPFREFRDHFWTGYNRENRLPESEMETLPVWLALRAMHHYVYQIKFREHLNFNPTVRAYFQLVKKYALEPLEHLSPDCFSPGKANSFSEASPVNS